VTERQSGLIKYNEDIANTEVCWIVVGRTVEAEISEVRHQTRNVTVVYALALG